MIKKVTVKLDLDKLGIIDPHFYLHKKELLIEDIINYTPEKIIYNATLEREDFIDDLNYIASKKSEILKKYNLEHFEIISIQKPQKNYKVLIIQKFPELITRLIKKYYNIIFLVPPIHISEETIKFNFLILEDGATNFLRLLKELEVPYNITKSVTISPIKKEVITEKRYKLTKKQKSVLNIAYKLGYFELPKKITMEELSKILKVSVPSTHRILKRIEKKGIENLIEQL